jgi:hypothetical protein
MSIVRCPRCRDEVTVPAQATGRALVRCPLCLEEYLLAEALANTPPPLVIIGGEVMQEALQLPAEGEVEYQLGATSGPSAAVLAHTASRRPVLRSSTRPRRAEKSGLFLLANYVLGGVLGLAMGLLVLWWGFKRDPLDLGPPIARYAPWIVPAAFHGIPPVQPSDAASPRPINVSPTTASADQAGDQAAQPSVKINKKPKVKPAASANEANEPPVELQTLPGFDEPMKLPGSAVSPTVDGPKLDRSPTEQTKPSDQQGATSSRVDLPTTTSLTEKLSPNAPSTSFQSGVATEATAKATEAKKPVTKPAAPRPAMPDLSDLLPD